MKPLASRRLTPKVAFLENVGGAPAAELLAFFVEACRFETRPEVAVVCCVFGWLPPLVARCPSFCPPCDCSGWARPIPTPAPCAMISRGCEICWELGLQEGGLCLLAPKHRANGHVRMEACPAYHWLCIKADAADFGGPCRRHRNLHRRHSARQLVRGRIFLGRARIHQFLRFSFLLFPGCSIRPVCDRIASGFLRVRCSVYRHLYSKAQQSLCAASATSLVVDEYTVLI